MAQHIKIFENGKPTDVANVAFEDVEGLEKSLQSSVNAMSDPVFIHHLRNNFDIGQKVGNGDIKVMWIEGNRFGIERKEQPNNFLIEAVKEKGDFVYYLVM